MDAVACATQTRDLIGIGGAFMLAPATVARGAELGLDFGEFYALGRGGVLGDVVDPDVVVASFGYFEPGLVRGFWTAATEKVTPVAAAAAYAEACQAWGRAHLSDVDELLAVVNALERAVDNASTVGAPLFGGWRSMPLPDDAPARAMQLLHVLRELRGGLHLSAVITEGLTPLQALTLKHPEQTGLFGWAEGAPDVEPLRPLHVAADDATDRMFAAALAPLSDAERDQLAAAVAPVVRAYAAAQA